jgi:hypothetical protein
VPEDTEVAELPALDAARTELATFMFPAPEDCVGDLTPITGLFYVEQWAYALLARWIDASATAADEDTDVQTQVAQALTGIGEACGNLDAACALMGIVPPEAADK